MSLNPPVNLPIDWRFKIIAPQRDNRVCMVSPDGYIASGPSRPLVAWLPQNVQPPGTLRRLFRYSHKISTYGQLSGYDADSEHDLTRIAQGPGTGTIGKDKIWMWSDSLSTTSWMTFIPLEKGARQPDGPGYLQMRYVSPTPLEGSEMEKLDPTGRTDLAEKYMSVDVTDEIHEVDLVDLTSGPKRSLTWQIQRVDQPHEPIWPLRDMGFSAVSWASATLRQVNSMYFLQAGDGGNRIHKASFTGVKWILGMGFGQVGDFMVAGNTQGLYSLTSDGAAWKYAEESNLTATKISTDDMPFSKLYARQTDQTLLGIVKSGTKAGNVYSCTRLEPPSWTALTDKDFQASVAVGSSGSIFAISSASSVYGEAGAIYQLAGGKAILIGGASMSAQQLVITKQFLVAVCPNNKAFLYEGSPNSWLDLTLPAVRPWGGIRGVVEGFDGTTPGSIMALSGDGKEVTYFRQDAHAFVHLFSVYAPEEARIVMEHTGDVQGILGRIGSEMYFLRTAIM